MLLGLFLASAPRRTPSVALPPIPPPPPRHSYLSATRHPWASLFFLLPLLLVYEGGVFWLGGSRPELLRNGADAWLHWLLEAFGLQQMYWAPVLIVATLLVWSWRRRYDRPRDLLGICTGMAIESLVWGVGLWGLSRCLGPTLDALGIVCEVPGDEPSAALPFQDLEGVARLITFLGAGIYEEALFRLALFWGIVWLLHLIEMSKPLAVILATVAASLAFAAAHHVGPYGEAFDSYVFLFRSLAGLYFTLIFLGRGFGVVVGAHACYDIFVSCQFC